ncbi:hypothetical protein MRX96_009824 [Rhipicephalus microplus]
MRGARAVSALNPESTICGLFIVCVGKEGAGERKIGRQRPGEMAFETTTAGGECHRATTHFFFCALFRAQRRLPISAACVLKKAARQKRQLPHARAPRVSDMTIQSNRQNNIHKSALMVTASLLVA